jgi:RimJ/RimL family protein N-acetyltransferase
VTVALAAPAPLHDGELALLPPGTDVAALMVAASNDREVTRWTQVPEGLTLRDAGLVTAGWSMPSSTIARFVVSHPDTGVAGMVTVWVNSSDEAEVGYWLLAHARGRGIARRAVQRLCAWAFEVGGAERLQLTTLPGNVASERVAAACGFSRDGTLVRDVKGESRTLSLWHRQAGAATVVDRVSAR